MTRKQPAQFRGPEVAYVVQRWKVAESCALIGTGSVGKSNLIQHLADPDIQAHYWPQVDRGAFRAIIIDPNLLGPLPDEALNRSDMRCWAGYELMMHRLFLAYYPFDLLGSDDARRFYETYQALQDGTNPLYATMGLRFFELGLDILFRRGAQVAFMFDEFDEMLKVMPVKFFVTLRGLRDAHKRQLSYVTFTRAPLPYLAERLGIERLAIEPFLELFTDNVHYIGPYSEPDARRMIDDYAQRRGKTYSAGLIDHLMSVTGRHAGLLRAALRSAEGQEAALDQTESADAVIAAFVTKAPIRSECRTIWSSLTPDEQVVLKAVARLAPYNVSNETEQAVSMLVQKRLLSIDRAQQRLEIQPPLFRAYLAKYGESDA